MNSKAHDILRTLQWLIPALVAFYGTIDAVFGIGVIGTVETLASALVTLIGVIAQHSSAAYFKDHEIIDAGIDDEVRG